MSLVGRILDRHYNAAHANHVHVEPATRKSGTPPTKNPGMTPGIKAIYDALERRFGKGAYFASPEAKDADWTHMGGWNRRPIAGSSTWSQHAWWNALDIGPYYGADQDKFVEFLKDLKEGKVEMTDNVGERKGVDNIFKRAWDKVRSWGVFSEHTDPDATPRNEEMAAFFERLEKHVRDEIARAVNAAATADAAMKAAKDAAARADRANARLDQLRTI